MSALIAAVFVASLLGSTHCAGMCGAFVAFAVGLNDGPKTRLHVAYNGGRLLTYMTMGVIAGAIGAALDLGGAALGLQRTAAVIAGATMVGFGVIALLRIRGVPIPKPPLPPGLSNLVQRAHKAARGKPPVLRAFIIGLCTTLLPCGWLYAFVVTAAGTASPAYGAITMAVFWAGTLPVMVAVGAGVSKLTGALGRHAPLITTLAVIAVWLWTMTNRLSLPAFTPDDVQAITVEQASMESAVEAASDTPPCCRED